MENTKLNAIIAIPSLNPGGLDAAVGAHFGHCDCYTLVNLEDNQVKDTKVIPGVPHAQGGCLVPVQYLAQNGAQVLIAGGMGFRPLMGFQQVGIKVFHGGQNEIIKDAVNAFIAGELPEFGQQHTCGGGGGQMHG